VIAVVYPDVVALTVRFGACKGGSRMVEPAELAKGPVATDLAATLAAHEDVLLRIAERLCASAADARDLVQDAFERATRQGIPADVRNPRAWLTTIMHNLFIDRCRAAARRPSHEPLDDAHGDVTPLAATQEPAWMRVTLDDVRVAAGELEPAFRDVYILATFERLSYDDIAKKLGIEKVTVGTRLNRARKKLRELLVAKLGLEDAP
jgi:RNA polymerase sigma-70 factor (ECF subfamily)